MVSELHDVVQGGRTSIPREVDDHSPQCFNYESHEVVCRPWLSVGVMVPENSSFEAVTRRHDNWYASGPTISAGCSSFFFAACRTHHGASRYVTANVVRRKSGALLPGFLGVTTTCKILRTHIPHLLLRFSSDTKHTHTPSVHEFSRLVMPAVAVVPKESKKSCRHPLLPALT